MKPDQEEYKSSKYEKRGRGRRKCIFCGRPEGLIRKYNLYICRQCFRERAEQLGFRKYGGD